MTVIKLINETTIKIAAAIIITVLIVGLVRKILKFAVMAVCAIIVGFFAYDFIVLGNNPIESIKDIRNDTVYIKDISGYTLEIQKDLSDIKETLKSDSSNTEKKNEITQRINNMKRIRSEIGELEHSERLDSLDDTYTEQLDKIISASEEVESSSSTAFEIIDKYSNSIDDISDEIKNFK